MHGWDEFLKIPKCFYDEFTEAVVGAYHPDNPDEVSSAECAAVLSAVAAVASTDIGAIEASHAKNRDISKLRASAWQPTLGFVSGKFVLRKVAKGRDTQASEMLKAVLKKEAARARGKRRQKRPGGPWRAYVHVQMQRFPGRMFDAALIRQFAADYKALNEDEKVYYKQLGYLANAAGRHGFTPFGPSLQDQNRPQPGDVTADGAVVAGDDPSIAALAVRGMNSRDFDEALAKARGALSVSLL